MSQAYSNDLREHCVNAMTGGEPASKVGDRFDVAKPSVIKWHRGDILEARWQAAKCDTRESGRCSYKYYVLEGKRKVIEEKEPGARDEDVHELRVLLLRSVITF